MGKRGGKARQPALPDWHLWHEVVRTVTPLRPRAVVPAEDTAPPPPEPPEPPTPPAPRRPAAPAYRPVAAPPSAVTPAGRVIEPGVRRKLVRGQIAIDGVIDLHGMRQDEAQAALARFVAARAARGDRTILVITGKGLKNLDETSFSERGILRTMLPVWLADPRIAAFVAGWDVAARGHGGEGAWYVRLRRREAVR